MTISRSEADQGFKLIHDYYYLSPYRFDTRAYFPNRNLDLYISYHMSMYQLTTIIYGIRSHGLPFINIIQAQTKAVIFSLQENGRVTAVLKGLACQQSLFIETMHLSQLRHGIKLLASVKQYVVTQHINHVSTDVMTVNNPHHLAYQLSGFTASRSINGERVYKITQQEIRPCRTSNAIINEFHDHHQANALLGNLASQVETPTSQHNNIEKFGLFMRDRHNQVVAGLIGEITTNNHSRNLTVDRLWIAETYRKNHFSSLFVRLAEQHAVTRGCTTASLHTMEYHAPWLYPKLGYHVFFKQQIGPFAGFYYEKNLTDNRIPTRNRLTSVR